MLFCAIQRGIFQRIKQRTTQAQKLKAKDYFYIRFVTSMIIKNKGYLFFALVALMGCAGTPDSDPKAGLETDSSNQVKITNTVTDLNVEKDTANQDIMAVDENCDEHFKAAMNQEKPADVVILHCEYSRTNHAVWLVHSYRFEIENNDALFNDIVDHNQMVKMQSEQQLIAHQSAWFLPKSIDNYEGFYTEDDFDDFEIFRDLKTHTIFIRGSQN